MAPRRRINDGTSASESGFTIMLRTANPERLLDICKLIMPKMNIHENTNFINAAIVAAVGGPKQLNDFVDALMRPVVSKFTLEYFWKGNKIDFPAYNLLGHMVLAGGFGDTSNCVNKYRERIKSSCIWECDIANCEIPEKLLRNMATVALSYPYDRCSDAGYEILQIYGEIDRMDLINPVPKDNSYQRKEIPVDNIFYKETELSKERKRINDEVQAKFEAHHALIDKMVAEKAKEEEEKEKERQVEFERKKIIKAEEDKKIAEDALLVAKNSETALSDSKGKRKLISMEEALNEGMLFSAKRVKLTEPVVESISLYRKIEIFRNTMGKFMSADLIEKTVQEMIKEEATVSESVSAIRDLSEDLKEAESTNIEVTSKEEENKYDSFIDDINEELDDLEVIAKDSSDSESEISKESIQLEEKGKAHVDVNVSADFIESGSPDRLLSTEEYHKRKFRDDINEETLGSVKKKFKQFRF